MTHAPLLRVDHLAKRFPMRKGLLRRGDLGLAAAGALPHLVAAAAAAMGRVALA